MTTWDSVPWAVGGGAEHSPEVARLLAYTASSGAEGIIDSGDLRVAPLDVPGAAVKVLPGAALIRNRSVGGSQQTYAARLGGEDSVAIAATGSGSGRSDLIVARIEDPFAAGTEWQDPTDPTVGPYIFTRVIANVPASTTSVADLGIDDSAVALARVDLPPSTGTVTAGMVVDLRKVANPNREREVRVWSPQSSTFMAVDSTFRAFPLGASWTLAVPAWATSAIVKATYTGLRLPSGNNVGNFRVKIGSTAIGLAPFNVNVPSGVDRSMTALAAEITVPEAMRGTNQIMLSEGFQSAGTAASMDSGSALIVEVDFVQRPGS